MDITECYPLMTAGMKDRRVVNFEHAVAALLAAAEAGSIRKVEYDDVKRTLGSAVYEGFGAVRGPYFHNGRWESLPWDVRQLDQTLGIPSSLHDVLSLNKKLAKSAVSHPAVEAMRAFASEALPLAMAAAALKDRLVKGRVISTEPAKPANPNKVIGTCPCCFRGIAVTGATMAHHGYERPGHGYQTASCSGIRFKPLEVSSEGLEWIVATTKTELAERQSAYEKRGSLASLPLLDQQAKRIKDVTRAMPEWPKVYSAWKMSLERDVRWLSEQLAFLEPKLQDWAQDKAWIAKHADKIPGGMVMAKQEQEAAMNAAISKMVEVHRSAAPDASPLTSWQNLRGLAEAKQLEAHVRLIDSPDPFAAPFAVTYMQDGALTGIETELHLNGKAVTTFLGERQPGTGPTADIVWQADQFSYAFNRANGPVAEHDGSVAELPVKQDLDHDRESPSP